MQWFVGAHSTPEYLVPVGPTWYLQVEPKVGILAVVGGSQRVAVLTPDDEFFLSVEKSLSRASIPNGR